MKQIIKRMIPNRMVPIARKIYRTFIGNSSKTDFSKERYKALKALKCTVSYNKYGGYCIPESSCHRPAALKILSNDIYEPETIEFIVSNSGDGDIVHAGTYFGDFLPALSKGCALNSKVWAFEPNPESYRCANITLQLNDINNVVLTNAGLGAKKEWLKIMLSDENGRALGGGSKIVDEKPENASGTVGVQIVTVDDTVGIDRTVSIIQLDVEGHEQEALSGALKTIRRCLPVIILEVLQDSILLESEWFSENILSLGYHKSKSIHGNVVFAC